VQEVIKEALKRVWALLFKKLLISLAENIKKKIDIIIQVKR